MIADYITAGYRLSQRRVCALIDLDRSTWLYKSVRPRREELRRRMVELAAARPRFGYRRIQVMLEREGRCHNHKLVYRLYTEEGLTMRRRKPRRRLRSATSRSQVVVPAAPDHRWAMDFVHDQTGEGGRIRLLTVVDHFTRESPAITVGRALRAEDVVRTLERLRRSGRKPKIITTDNGSEFCSKLLDQWAFVHSVQLDFIQPGKPVENAFIESFNGRVREECLNAQWFDTLAEAKAAIEAWRIDYNRNRPHGALGQLTPREFRRRWSAQQRSIDAALLTR
jgi:putative transposase